MKRKYETPKMTEHTLHTEMPILAGSVVLEEKEFKAHTESYEIETIDWDTISFE